MEKFCLPPLFMEKEDEITRITYDSIYFRIENLALNVLRWDGLPKNISQLLIERYLFYYGMCAIFKDEVLEDYVVLPVTTVLWYDENGIPIEYEVKGYHGYSAKLNRDNSVLIFNNYNGRGDSIQAGIFASRLTEIKRTIDVHTKALRINKIIPTTENKVNSVKRLIQKITGYELYTIASPSLLENLKNVSSIDVSTPYYIDKLDNHYRELWAECYNYFGVENAPEKRERLLVDEISVQTSAAETYRTVRLNPRQDACEKINAMFGLNISCHVSITSLRGNGGDEDEQINHDTENIDGSDNE